MGMPYIGQENETVANPAATYQGDYQKCTRANNRQKHQEQCGTLYTATDIARNRRPYRTRAVQSLQTVRTKRYGPYLVYRGERGPCTGEVATDSHVRTCRTNDRSN